MARQLFDPGIYSVLTSGGAIGVGWQLSFYTAGTTSSITTWNAATSGSANATTLASDSHGRFPPAWIDEGQTIKWVMTDENGANPLTVDNVPIVALPVSPDSGLTNFLSAITPLPIVNGGTNATSAANALAQLGAVAKAGDTVTGNIVRNAKGCHTYFHDAAMVNPEIFITASASADPRGGLPGQVWLKY